MKLKKLIKESVWGKRAFGEKLPTIDDYKEAYNKNKLMKKMNLLGQFYIKV